MSLKDVAKETLTILDRGFYEHEESGRVDLWDLTRSAVERTCLHRPDELAAGLEGRRSGRSSATIMLSDERTQEAARRLTAAEGDLVLLNFASARNPGGGFINGAKAQEEDLARCSALVPCLETQPDYYEANRQQRSMLYTDHLIYSPNVPFFRTRSTNLLPELFVSSVITAPAPNAGQHLDRNPDGRRELDATLERRAGYALWVAKHHGHRRLLLGAWGCGVFRNDPQRVATAFRSWLDAPQFADAFDLVHFAVFDPTRHRSNYNAFESVLRSPGTPGPQES